MSKSKSKWYKHQKNKKFASNLQLQTIQFLTNNVQMLILCLSYLITTVPYLLRYLPLWYLVSLYQLAFTKCIKQYLLLTCKSKLRLIKKNHTKHRSSKFLLFLVRMILNQSVHDDLPQMILYSTWLKISCQITCFFTQL